MIQMFKDLFSYIIDILKKPIYIKLTSLPKITA